MQNAKTSRAYGSIGTQASSSNLRNLLGVPTGMTNLSYVAAAIQAMADVAGKPTLLIFVFEQTNATYGTYAKFKFVYPIGNTYNALPWITASPS